MAVLLGVVMLQFPAQAQFDGATSVKAPEATPMLNGEVERTTTSTDSSRLRPQNGEEAPVKLDAAESEQLWREFCEHYRARIKASGQNTASRVIVIDRSADKFAVTLSWLGVPFTDIPFKQSPFYYRHLVKTIPWSDARVILLPCGNPNTSLGYWKSAQQLEDRLQRFVSDGGTLITSGYSIYLLPKIFPGYVSPRYSAIPRVDKLFVGIADAVSRKPVFKSETAAQRSTLFMDIPTAIIQEAVPFRAACGVPVPVEVSEPDRVQQLVTGNEPALEHSVHQEGTVFLFRFGKGRVLHFVNHMQPSYNFKQHPVSLAELMALNAIDQALNK